MTSAPADLLALPHDLQLARIEEAMDAGQELSPLLLALGRQGDPSALAHMLAALARRERLGEVAQALGTLLGTLPDPSLRAVLRSLEGPEVNAEQRAIAVDAVTRAVESLPMERLAGICWMDRWLKNVAPQAREAICQRAEEACAGALAHKELSSLPDEALLRLPAARHAGLLRLAQKLGLEDPWQQRLSAFARRVVRLLEAAPRSLSQANAEEILARRVYAEPGHFLIELLQNAEDARASEWRVTLHERQGALEALSVWHDGLPFDAKDVVGVLSIGQTTKHKQQIGLFGVGFKSVHEVTDRPQVYSGPFQFEIATVSVPRWLEQRPESAGEGTLLVLPARPGAYPRAALLYERALAVPPETLLTLTSLGTLSLACGARFRMVRREADGDGLVRLLVQDEQKSQSRRYWIEQDSEPSSRSPVRIAVAADEHGFPQPVAQGTPTLFAFLPTPLRTGLRLLIHAPFDLPVDRERLDLGSPFNREALGRAGRLLADWTLRRAQEGQDGVGLLGILPLARELGHPQLLALLQPLYERLAGLAFLPGADGQRLAPQEAAVLDDPALVPALAGIGLDEDGRKALLPLPPREREVALALGARAIGAEELQALLARELQSLPEGAKPTARWLKEGLPPVLLSLARAGALGDLPSLPLLPDDEGALFRPCSLGRAEPALHRLYGRARPLLALAISEDPQYAPLLRALSVRTLTADDLVEDLREEERASLILQKSPVGDLLDYLSSRPLGRSLGALRLFPDQRGVLRTLTGQSCVLLAPEGPWGGLLRWLPDGPPLLEPALAQRHGGWLRSHGLVELDPVRSLPWLAALPSEQLRPLHQALAALASDLTPRFYQQLAALPVFFDRQDQRRALLGEDRALRPADARIVELFPERPWLADDLALLPHLPLLGVEVTGAEAVARWLLQGETVELRAAYTYLVDAPWLSEPTRAALAAAPLWLDDRGGRWPLGALGLAPSEPDLAALFQALSLPCIESEGPCSALALARALRLEGTLARRGYEALVPALCSAPLPPALPRTLLHRALRAAAARLPRQALLPLLGAPLFLGEEEALGPLASWEAPSQAPGLRRADPPLRQALAALGLPLLAEGEQAALGPLFDALGLRSAEPRDLVGLLEHSQALPGELRTLARQTLAACGDLSGLAQRISALPLWPSQDGRWLPATAIVRGEEALAALLGEDWRQDPAWLVLGGVLHPEAEPEASALAPFLSFGSPLGWVRARLAADARPGQPLDEQPAFLRGIDRLCRLLLALAPGMTAEALERLPLVLDAQGRLVAGRRFQAHPDEVTLARGTALLEQLAHPQWASAAAASVPSLCPPLPARRLLAALASICAPARTGAAQPLQDGALRQVLYRWLLERASEIEADPEARGILGKCPCLLSQGGSFRAPRELLVDEALALEGEAVPASLEELRPAEEVPEPLVRWLGRVYALESTQLPILVSHLLERCEAAARSQDLDALHRQMQSLARLLCPPEREPAEQVALIRKLGVARRLQVETAEGKLAWPHQLLAADPEKEAQLAAFLSALPPRIAARYQTPALLALLRASGARPDLDDERLAAALERPGERKEGLEALLALARYLLPRLVAEPALQQALPIDKACWIPDEAGEPRSPAALCWPSPELEALLGPRPDRWPHPEWLACCPSAALPRLPFRKIEDLPLQDILQGAEQAGGASAEALGWLERALQSGRLSADALRRQAGSRRLFLDEGGQARPRSALLRKPEPLFGQRRGVLALGQQHPRLLDALNLPRATGPQELSLFLEEVAADLAARGQALRSDEPELIELLPRCLERLAQILADRPPKARGEPDPARVPLVALSGQEKTLCLASDPRLRLPPPEGETAPAAHLVPAGLGEAGLALLARWGVRPYSDPTPAPAPAPQEAPPSQGLLTRLRTWWQRPQTPEPPKTEDRAPSSKPRVPSPEDELKDKLEDELEDELEPPRTPSRPPSPRSTSKGPTRDEHWFRPQPTMAPQQHAATEWLADRPRAPRYGFAFAPGELPFPYLYAPRFIGGRFDPYTQDWVSLKGSAEWSTAAPGQGTPLTLVGRVPGGEVILPVPLYGRILEIEAGDAVLVTSRDGHSLLRCPSEREIRYTLSLGQPPNFSVTSTAEAAPRALLERTVPDAELPPEVHRFLEALHHSGRGPLSRALAVQNFIRERYRYDGGALEDPALAAWLRGVVRGKKNRQVAMLHARRDHRHLGAGVCYELGVLATELLRRSDVPAAVCTGWTFDRGTVSEPDHLWALALLPSREGRRWLPIDASSTAEGRPLHTGPRPPGPWKAPPPQGPLPEGLPLDEGRARPRRWESSQGPWDEAEILRRCRAMLREPAQAEKLLAFLQEQERDCGD